MEAELRRLRDASMLRVLTPRQMDGVELIEGERRLVNFGSNDYLGIAMDASRVGSGDGNRAGRGGAGAEGQVPRGGAAASPLVCGYGSWHERLCCRLAALERTEAAVLFPTGFAACSGTITALAGAGDLILSDALNHASLIDGCRLSKAERFIYPHCDVAAVSSLLAAHRAKYRRVFLVTDAVFSMDGTRAPVVDLVRLCEQHDAVLVVDEAHATGVLGTAGGGLCEEMGVSEQVPVRIGTMSKALGGHGGFVAARRVVIDYLIQRARSLIFSTAAPPMTVAAVLDALDVVSAEPERRTRLRELGDWLRERLRGDGWRVIGEGTPIVPVITGTPERTLALSQRLREAGFFVPPVRPPTVPPGQGRLRISLTAAHRHQHVEALADALAALR
jgi:8-amino-7-oxononanoate synthase